jgi:hypothetical protein
VSGNPTARRTRRAPHPRQKFDPGGFSCWHPGQCIPRVSQFRIVSGQPGTASRHPGRHRRSASRPSRGARTSRPYPDLASGARWRFWGVVRPGAHGETRRAAPTSQNSRLRRAPDGYRPSWRPDPHPLEAPPEPGEGGSGRSGRRLALRERASRGRLFHKVASRSGTCRGLGPGRDTPEGLPA